MSSPSPAPPADLLRQAAELLAGELDLLSQERWEDLPELKRRKLILAVQLRQKTWPVGAGDALSELENRTHARMREMMRLTAQRIGALQELHLYCLECDSISLRASAAAST